MVMIFQGEKVEVIASYTNGKGAKIRVGSKGYITKTHPNVTHLTNNRGNRIILIPAEIVFSRYGFEKRSRSERKLVDLIYPGYRGIGNNNITNMKKFLDSSINFAMSASSGDKKKVVAIRKSQEPINLLYSRSERVSWLKSVTTKDLSKYTYPMELRDKLKFTSEVERVDKNALVIIEDLVNSVINWDHKREMLLINCVADDMDMFKSIYIIIKSLLSNTARHSIININKRKRNRISTDAIYSSYLQLAMNGLYKYLSIGNANGKMKDYAYRIANIYKKMEI
jgi:hypothetical protein